MVSAQASVDEDYLLLSTPDGRPTTAVAVTAQKPANGSPETLRDGERSLLRAFMLLTREPWPHCFTDTACVTRKILRHLKHSFAPGVENHISSTLAQEELRAASRPFWDRPPWIPLRALRVASCGWSSLSSAPAIERVVTLE